MRIIVTGPLIPMRIFCLPIFVGLIAIGALTEVAGQESLSDTQRRLRSEFAAKAQASEKKNAAACAENDSWLFLASELRFLSLGPFWGSDAPNVSRSHKAVIADPIPAILDFHQQLKARRIDLLVVPVPPKAAIYPEKILSGFDVRTDDAAPVLRRFYGELRAAGVEVLDLTPLMIRGEADNQYPTYCKTDSHWSGTGCMLAARAIGERIGEKIAPLPARKEFVSDWKEVQIMGDLVGLLPADAQKPGPEKVRVRRINEKRTGAGVEPDPSSPVLLLGDSHTLVFHDFFGEHAGLVDQLAQELGFAPDLIGTRGSGATPVRINLYRHSVKNPSYLANKKVIVWCFAAREFTEASEGWTKIPVAR